MQKLIMEDPFIYGRIATDENFIDREVETTNLVWNFVSLSNTIIISPRGWGKSSLVNKAAKLAMEKDNKLRICHIDLFNVRNEEHFYSLLAQKVIAATSSKWEEAVENAKSFFSHLVPKISIGTDPTNEVSIDFDWDDVKRIYKEYPFIHLGELHIIFDEGSYEKFGQVYSLTPLAINRWIVAYLESDCRKKAIQEVLRISVERQLPAKAPVTPQGEYVSLRQKSRRTSMSSQLIARGTPR